MQSMTGFGRFEGKIDAHRFTIEIKSVNHRYSDARFRLPGSLSFCELSLLECLRNRCERGSFEISIRQKLLIEKETVTTGTKFAVDEGAVESLIEAYRWLKKKYKIEPTPSLEALTLTNRVFVPVEDDVALENITEPLLALFVKAIDRLIQSRQAEGTRLKNLLSAGVLKLKDISERAREFATEHPTRVYEKLNQRIQSWKFAQSVDNQRLEWEVALYAERSDITEELDRLRAHLEEFSNLLELPQAVGRRLDFLTQELHREVNTMASKANFLPLTQLTLEAKSTIEKLREQVQNVE